MKTTKMRRLAVSSSLSVFLAGCGAPNYGPSQMHINAEEESVKAPKSPRDLPQLVRTSPTAPLFHDAPGSETFDVVVTNVPVRDLLFALARDAGVNMDVDSRVGGIVSISALDQTLEAILDRISRQVEIRVERVGETLIVKPDEAYHQKYQIDFVNISRTYSSSATGGGVGNTGSSSVSNTSGNNFWQSLESGVAAILSISGEEGDSVFEETENADRLNAAQDSESLATGEFGEYYYNLNRDTGLLLVFAPERLQHEIREYLDVVTSIAKRQVLLEATVVEVILSNQYKQGIDWSFFNSLATNGLALYQGANVGGAAAALSFITEALDIPDRIEYFRRHSTETGKSPGTMSRTSTTGSFIPAPASPALAWTRLFHMTPRRFPPAAGHRSRLTPKPAPSLRKFPRGPRRWRSPAPFPGRASIRMRQPTALAACRRLAPAGTTSSRARFAPATSARRWSCWIVSAMRRFFPARGLAR